MDPLTTSPDRQPIETEPSPQTLSAEMRTIGLVAGQCSVEGTDDHAAAMAAAESERCLRWADQLDASAARQEEAIRQLRVELEGEETCSGNPITSLGLRHCMRLQGETIAILEHEVDRLTAEIRSLRETRQEKDE